MLVPTSEYPIRVDCRSGLPEAESAASPVIPALLSFLTGDYYSTSGSINRTPRGVTRVNPPLWTTQYSLMALSDLTYFSLLSRVGECSAAHRSK